MSKDKPEIGETWRLKHSPNMTSYVIGFTEANDVVYAYKGRNAIFQRTVSSWLTSMELFVPKKVRYLNVYAGMPDFATRQEADDRAGVSDYKHGAKRVAVVRVEYEEGQFDE